MVDPRDEGFAADWSARLRTTLDERYPGVRGIVVARHGKIVFEQYEDGATAATAFPLDAVTATVLGMMLGVAVGGGDVGSMESLLGDVLTPEVVAAEDQRVQEMTFRQVVTMRAGWNNEPVSGKNSVIKAVNRPLARDPGEEWRYDDATPHIVSAAISRATGFVTGEYSRQALFLPLGIAPGEWEKDADGLHFGNTGLSLKVRDLAKLGELYLRGGEWKGRTLVHRRWVEASTKDWTDTDDPDYGYGYFWWIHRPTKSYAGFGDGGQTLWVNAAKDVVVAVAGDPQHPPRVRELVTESVLPAAEDSAE